MLILSSVLIPESSLQPPMPPVLTKIISRRLAFRWWQRIHVLDVSFFFVLNFHRSMQWHMAVYFVDKKTLFILMWRSSVRCHFHSKLLRTGIFVCLLISQSKIITRTTTDKHQIQSSLVLTMSAITRCCLEIKNSNRVAKSFVIFGPHLGI